MSLATCCTSRSASTSRRRASRSTRSTQSVYPVSGQQKVDLLLSLIQRPRSDRVLVFTRTKHRADRVARVLGKNGISGAAIHGNRSQSQRQQALEGFKRGKHKVLVATDIVARGIDVDGISHVINFDLPRVPETTSTASAAPRAPERAAPPSRCSHPKSTPSCATSRRPSVPCSPARITTDSATPQIASFLILLAKPSLSETSSSALLQAAVARADPAAGARRRRRYGNSRRPVKRGRERLARRFQRQGRRSQRIFDPTRPACTARGAVRSSQRMESTTSLGERPAKEAADSTMPCRGSRLADHDRPVLPHHPHFVALGQKGPDDFAPAA